MSSNRQLTGQALEQGQGVLRMHPNWVPRSFCVPGRRLRLHPADLYALGGSRGGIDERWFSSTTFADNGPGTPEDEGLSYIYVDDARKVTLRDALAELGPEIIGQEAIDRYGGWVMYSKFFDNMYPLPHHLHHSDEKAKDIGKLGKPEAYYYPPQYNQTNGTFPYTFFGFDPGTTRDQVIDCLKRWEDGDNGILELSRAYRLQLGTGWDVAPGILHAPGTLCTYEPQRASDVFSMWQSLIADQQFVDRALLVKDVPADKAYDYDYLLSLLDWEANTDPDFAKNHFLAPRPAGESDGYSETWIVYGSEYFSAKELTVEPGRTVTVRDKGAYGMITTQGYGRFGPHPISAPTMIRFGQMTEDEFFVTASAAAQGVTITNLSATEPLVMIKHFNPGNPDMPSR
ncbi:MAG TPA: hypothetical protein PKX07_12790 [Aggregatilineales bacterium]|nr:hypothetical protein [Aggregatilineales bacterium]